MEKEIKELNKVLEKEILTVSKKLPKGITPRKLEVFQFGTELAIQLTAICLNEQIDYMEKEVKRRFPATWWDHLKKRLGWKYKELEFTDVVKFERTAWHPDANFQDVLGQPTERITVRDSCSWASRITPKEGK